jgi:hypothetical protein
MAVISKANSTPPNQKKLKWIIDIDESGQSQSFDQRLSRFFKGKPM